MANKKSIPLSGAGSQPRRVAEIKREQRRLNVGNVAPTCHPSILNLSDKLRNRQAAQAAKGSSSKTAASKGKASSLSSSSSSSKAKKPPAPTK